MLDEFLFILGSLLLCAIGMFICLFSFKNLFNLFLVGHIIGFIILILTAYLETDGGVKKDG